MAGEVDGESLVGQNTHLGQVRSLFQVGNQFFRHGLAFLDLEQ